jgi:Tfp pilus assembly protein PilV
VTITEVLVTCVILGIGLVGVGSLVTYGVISHRKSVCYTIATARATQEIERVREAGYAGAVVSTQLFPSTNYTILSATQARFDVPELSNGFGYVTIEDDTEAQQTNPATGQPYSNLKRARVQIFWSGPRSLSGSYAIATLLANRP